MVISINTRVINPVKTPCLGEAKMAATAINSELNITGTEHRGQTFGHVRVAVRVEVFLHNIQGSVKALSLLFGQVTINQVECNLLRCTGMICLFCFFAHFLCFAVTTTTVRRLKSIVIGTFMKL